MKTDRRKFLRHLGAGAAGAGITSMLAPLGGRAAAQPPAGRAPEKGNIRPADLSQIALEPGSRLYRMAVANADYLLLLDTDRLLYNFRAYAGVDTRGARPLGGWEEKDFGFRGHFTGHYLSACAQSYHHWQASDPERSRRFSEAVSRTVAGLRQCQLAIARKTGADAPGYPGYLNAQGPDPFDRLERLQSCAVPYYVIHKILAGLLDAYQYAREEEALLAARDMTAYFNWRMDRLDPERIEAMVNTRRYTGQQQIYFMEFGGMHDVLLNLYAATGEEPYRKLAGRFERKWFTDMLAGDHDLLGLNAEHSNTEIPNVIGMANAYELTADESCRRGVLNFLGWMAGGHQFPTGGVSGKAAYQAPLDYGGELFGYPRQITRQVNSTPGHPYHNCGESCCSHNLNKVTQYAFRWTASPRWAEQYENRFVNAVMAQQNPRTAMLLYNLNLKQGARKEFGTPNDTFWCCYGTGVEAYASLAQGAYYTQGAGALWINRLLAGTFHWPETGLSLSQRTNFPDDGHSVMTFSLPRPARFRVHLLVPSWARGTVMLRVNGKDHPGEKTPGTYVTIDREWHDGDQLETELPFSLASQPMPDERRFIAVTYGPHVLVSDGAAGAVFRGTEKELVASLSPAGISCRFTGTLSSGPVTFKPVSSVVDEPYNGYTVISRPAAEQPTDRLVIGEEHSETAHRMLSLRKGQGVFREKRWMDAADEGWISFEMAVHPSRDMYLKCRYWGGDGAGKDFYRLFDLEVKDTRTDRFCPIATQSLDREYPEHWYDVLYPVPRFLTEGRQSVRLRFRGKGFLGKSGRAGGVFDIVQAHYYERF